jgi:hypothetical protein
MDGRGGGPAKDPGEASDAASGETRALRATGSGGPLQGALRHGPLAILLH